MSDDKEMPNQLMVYIPGPTVCTDTPKEVGAFLRLRM